MPRHVNPVNQLSPASFFPLVETNSRVKFHTNPALRATSVLIWGHKLHSPWQPLTFPPVTTLTGTHIFLTPPLFFSKNKLCILHFIQLFEIIIFNSVSGETQNRPGLDLFPSGQPCAYLSLRLPESNHATRFPVLPIP